MITLTNEIIPAGNTGLIKGPQIYDVSYAQRRLWLQEQFEDLGDVYHMPFSYGMENIDVQAVETAFMALVHRHESFRTTIAQVEGEPRQFIHAVEDFAPWMVYEDLRGELDIEATVERKTAENAKAPFDLAKGPLIRARLLRIKDNEYLFLITLHHIICDGYSMQVMEQEFNTFYGMALATGEVNIAPLSLQYKDYAVWQKKRIEGGELNRSRTYWLNHLSGTLPVLNLCAEVTRPLKKNYEGATVGVRLPDDLRVQLFALCQQEKASVFIGVLSIINILLYRYSAQEDQVLGIVVAGRNDLELENQIGFYVNTLALRSHISAESSFIEILERVKDTVFNAQTHQEYPFDLLVGELEGIRDTNRHPVFDIMVNYIVLEAMVRDRSGEVDADDYTVQIREGGASKHDMSFVFTEEKGALLLEIEYNTTVYPAAWMKKFTQHFINIARSLVQAPVMPVGSMAYLDQQEQQYLLSGLNNTFNSFDHTATITTLFEQQVRQTPNSIALQMGDIAYTYTQLNEIAGQLARYLVEGENVTPGSIVGVMQTRSPWMIISILGILKCGAAYLPIDPEYPPERKKYMLENARIGTVLIDKPAHWPTGAVARQVLVNDLPLQELSPLTNSAAANPDALAYIIYTSGSTGLPKGVMITHKSVVNFCEWLKALIYADGAPRNCMLTAPISFDASVQQLFPPLVYGSKLILISDEERKDPNAYARSITTEQVQVLDCTPGYLEVVLEALTALKGALPVMTTLIGGEPLKRGLVQRYYTLFPKGSRLINVYGLTEATVDSTYEITSPEEETTSIGTAVHNTGIYILDARHQLLPVGVAGEIAIGGEGLAKGYLYDEKRTAERFIPHPYTKGEKLLLTGDQGYWRTDGKLIFIGRKDNQIKLRGFRIELGEIEYNIAGLAGVAECCVKLIRSKVQGDYLVAYYSGRSTEERQLKALLKDKLPDYMIPSRFIYFDSLPLNANGKVDRSRLPDHEPEEEVTPATAVVAPVSDTEILLAGIWKEVLGKQQISIHDNFLEIGGHSLKAMQVITRVYRTMEVELMLRDIFSYPSIAALAAEIDARKGTQQVSRITVTPAAEYYEVSSTQRRLWMVDQFGKAGHVYNVSGIYKLEHVQVAALQRAIDLLAARHEVLRTTIALVKGAPKQKVHAPGKFDTALTVVDLQQKEPTPDEIREMLETTSATNFDLSQGPLMKCWLFHTSAQHAVLLIVIHHILVDGWSMDILKRELLSFYEEYRAGRTPVPAPLSFQYRDFATWQHRRANNKELDVAAKYWHNKLAGELPVTELLPDKMRAAERTYEGAALVAVFPEQLREKLSLFCRSNGATLFMGLVSMLKVLLYRYTNQEDVLIGTVGTGRDHLELEDKVGLYINTLALRTDLAADSSDFTTVLEKVKETVLSAFQYQDYPFDTLVANLGKEWAPNRNPLFDILVHVYNAAEGEALVFDVPANVDDIQIHKGGKVPSKFDLNFSFLESDKAMSLSIMYNTALYEEERIAGVLRHFMTLADQLLTHPTVPVSRINFLSAEEEALLLKKGKGATQEQEKYNSVNAWFEQQAAATPHANAVFAGGRFYTYAELNSAANGIARHLTTQLAIKKQEIVAVYLSRSFEFVASVLGIVKAGATYLPIDRSNPPERIQDILEQAQVKYLFTDEAFQLRDNNTVLLNITELLAEMPAAIDNIPETNTPEDAAYVIFTSGSGGRPKGVLIAHHSLMNLCSWHQQQFQVDADSKATLYAGTGFDASVWEMWPYLLQGACLHVLPVEVQQREDLMAQFLREREVSHMFLPTAAYESLADKQVLTEKLQVFTGGEMLKKTGSGNWKLYNCYGPTETTVVATFAEIQPGAANITIGKPVSNARIYLLDASQQLAPDGCKGEIYIGGEGVAIGYLNDAALTREKFIPDPWQPGQRLYRTGDWGYWNASGQLVFAGRQDNQVKIRGFRIELEEIERVMMQVENITHAVVISRTGNNGEARLLAWYKGDVTENAMREYLTKQLPGYMVPFSIQQVASFVLTTNGKIDRTQLPQLPVSAKTTRELKLPVTASENILHEIWQRIFGKDIAIGVDDNFFELGGHSMKAMQLINAIYNELNVAVTFRDIFGYPAISSLAVAIDEQLASKRMADVALLVKLGEVDPELPSMYCIPAIHGSATVYTSLAKAVRQQVNSYGLFYPGFFMGQPFPEDLHVIAQRFVAEITAVQQKSAPFFLLGYSMGAWIGFEATKILEEQGYTVTLVLIDKNVDLATTALPGDTAATDMNEGLLDGLDELFSEKEIAHLKNLYEHNLHIHGQHHISGTVNADIFAIQGNNTLVTTDMAKWKAHSLGLFSSFDINATHKDILKAAHIPVLTKIMKRILIS